MLDSVVANGHTFDECKELLKKCTFIDAFLGDGEPEVLLTTTSYNAGREFLGVLLLV